ncbi:peptide/nickel transport system substrate-binding protein [Arboricoccus pini]|uniref:Peptide/nickel transport system substrate-binding protein n=1 Tax=Arboricoccus pini TaxID=1963835 RepID=A0A212RP46_9PROT|nr:ABC transporter substrate-binding protein [Arboricoccus pini]SNB74309.1 peptide/nickel transport system substrate-binding protein [Arboricoccus pini]
MRYRWSALIALVAAMHVGTAAAVERGGVMTFGRYADSLFLDPASTEVNVDIWILSNLYDTLILPSDDGKGLQPGLATSWSFSGDNKTLTLKLRDGIKFSDGSPITSADAKWSLDRTRNPDTGAWASLYESIDSIAAPDPSTVVINLKHPDPALLPVLTAFASAVMPSKLIEATAGATLADKVKAFAEHPVGSGPFKLQSWKHDAEMKLVPNPYYWRMGEDGKPLPYLDGVTFEVIPDDATRILRLKSGELDASEFIPYARVEELKNDSSLNMELFPSTRIEYVALNVRPELDGKPNPLANPKLREALNYATDKDAIVGIVTHGVGTPMTSFMSTATPLHVGDKPLYPVDVDKAKQIMHEAGLDKGVKVTLMTLAGNEDEVGIATALQQMWKEIGVDLEIQQIDNATRTAAYRAGTFPSRLSLWTDDIADPSEITSWALYYPAVQSFHTGWKNDKAVEIFQASQKEMDPAKRQEEYKQLQEIFNSEGPTVPLYETPYPVALAKRVQGFNQLPLGNNLFAQAWLKK